VTENRVYHVATGNYFISETEMITAEAFLGSCVGVALFDPKNKIGGIIHFLLPEPISEKPPEEPLKFVTTGLPIFISELLEKGALRKNLKACVAGGALMEPLTQHDLALDIGGRNADAVKKILSEQGVAIEHSETGGLFKYALRLNMKTWETDISLAGSEKAGNEIEQIKPMGEKIDQAFSEIKPIPQTSLKVMRMLDGENFSFKKIAIEIGKDQVISASVLRLCNSVFFKGIRKIDTLDDALILLGRDNLIKSVLLAAIKSYFQQCGMGYALCKGNLYHHSISSAIFAEKLAKETGKVRPETAYTAGLLHDIGMVVLDHCLSSSSPMFYRRIQKKNANILAVEKEIFETNHCEVGQKLAEKWSFPSNLKEVIAFHHHPEYATENPELVHIVSVSELILSRFHTSFELDPTSSENFAARLEKLGLSISQFPDIVNLIPIEALGVDPEMATMGNFQNRKSNE